MLSTKMTAFDYLVSNMGAASASAPGTSVVPGASNAEGSWTQVLSALTYDIYWIELLVCGGATASTNKAHFLDVGPDPAGGTSYIQRIGNIVCGGSPVWTQGAVSKNFPLYIKAGSTVAVRIQGVAGTAGTVRVVINARGLPQNPELFRSGGYSETIGSVTNTQGNSITPGTSGEGSWTSFGTTTRNLFWWQMGFHITSTTLSQLMYYFDLAHGDANNKEIIFQDVPLFIPVASPADQMALAPMPWGYHEVKGGDTIYVRAACSGTPLTTVHGLVNAIG